MSKKSWFDEKHDAFKDDPEYVAEELALDIVLGLQARMRVLNLKQSELAKRIGASPAFVSQVLHGKPNMTVLTLAKFSTALGLTCSLKFDDARAERKWDQLPRSTTQFAFSVAGSGGRHPGEGMSLYAQQRDSVSAETVVNAEGDRVGCVDQGLITGGLGQYDLPAAAS